LRQAASGCHSTGAQWISLSDSTAGGRVVEGHRYLLVVLPDRCRRPGAAPARIGQQRVVQCRPGDADKRAYLPPHIVEVNVAQQRAVLVAVLEPVDDRAALFRDSARPLATKPPMVINTTGATIDEIAPTPVRLTSRSCPCGHSVIPKTSRIGVRPHRDSQGDERVQCRTGASPPLAISSARG
jgi:hypothetical protein